MKSKLKIFNVKCPKCGNEDVLVLSKNQADPAHFNYLGDLVPYTCYTSSTSTKEGCQHTYNVDIRQK